MADDTDALAAVLTAARRRDMPVPAQNAAAALETLAGRGAMPARVVVVVRPAAAAAAAAVARGLAPSATVARWCADAAALLAALPALARRTTLAVEFAAEAADPVATALGAFAVAGVPEVARLTAELSRLAPPLPSPAPTALADAAALAFARHAGPTVVRAARADDPADAATRIAELAAERDLLAASLAEVQAAWQAAAVDVARLHRHVVDLTQHGAGHPAFYDREDGGGRPFRWLGRSEVATFETLVPRNRPVRVEVAVEIAIEPAAIEALELALDGEVAHERTITQPPEGGARIVATFPARAEDDLYRARLALRPRLRQSMIARGDPRTLSVGISTIVVEQLPVPRPREDPVVGRALLDAPRTLEPGEPLGLSVLLPAGRPVRVAVAAEDAAARLDALVVALNGIPAATAAVSFAPGGGAIKSATFVSEAGGPARLDLSLADGPPLALTAVTLADAGPRDTPPPPERQEIRVDREEFGHGAFYGIERTADGRAFRWLGRAAEARIAFDGVAAGAVRVEVHIVHAISPAALEGFGFGFDGRLADGYDVRHEDDGTIVKSALLASDSAGAGWNRPMRLSLVARETVDLSERGDPRTLAVAIAKLVVIPV